MSIAAFEIVPQEKRMCLVVGLGLIGSRIAQYLSWHTTPIRQSNLNKFDWENPQKIGALLTDIITTHNTKFVEIVWSAGKAGFSATNTEMAKEFATYTGAMKTLKALKGVDVYINLLSSAGGIYENSNFVDDLDYISPDRPYALWKLKQEQFLHEIVLKARIYRVSSVYGLSHKKARSGLINHLIANTKTGQTTSIYAHQNTLRDYIFNNDVARHITENILLNTNPCLELIASGRATSINMLLNIVANITKLPVKAIFLPSNDNDKDIIFNSNLISQSLKQTSLEEGIRIMNTFSLKE